MLPAEFTPHTLVLDPAEMRARLPEICVHCAIAVASFRFREPQSTLSKVARRSAGEEQKSGKFSREVSRGQNLLPSRDSQNSGPLAVRPHHNPPLPFSRHCDPFRRNYTQ